MVSRRYLKIFFTPTQCLLISDALYLANKVTANDIPGLVQFARYTSALIALRYGNSRPNISSSLPLGLNGSLSLVIQRSQNHSSLMDMTYPCWTFNNLLDKCRLMNKYSRRNILKFQTQAMFGLNQILHLTLRLKRYDCIMYLLCSDDPQV